MSRISARGVVRSETDHPTTELGEPRVIPVRHWGRWTGAAITLVVIAMLIRSMVTNPNYQWSVVARYLFDDAILQGVLRTLGLTLVSMLVGILTGLALAVMRLSPNPLLSGASWVYLWFFRGTPLLVQIIFWYYLGALFPRLGLGIPFGPVFLSVETNALISQFTAAMLGLGLNMGAYMAEIFRSGIIAVGRGQREAAYAIGMTRSRMLRRIILPQAMRVIVPPTGNETLSMLKNTALVIVIAYAELMTTVQAIYARTFQTIPLLIVASIWYLFITSVFMVGQYFIEVHYGQRGGEGEEPQTLRLLSAARSGRWRIPRRMDG